MKHVAIVGSGPAAFFLARRLLDTDSELCVTVLEAGPQTGSAPERHPIRERGRAFKMDPTTHLGFGGTSELWHNVLAPLDPIDFEHRPWIQSSGWPINRAVLDPHYLAVGRYLNIPAHLFQAENLPTDIVQESFLLKFDRDVFQNKIFLHPRRYFRAAQHFSNLKKKAGERLRWLCDALVQEVIVDNQGKACGLRFVDVANNEPRDLESDAVVICAGGLRSARVLLNSRIREKTKSQVGRYLLDHPMGVIYQFRTPARQHIRLYTDRPLQPDCKIKSALRLTDARQREWKMPNSAFYLRPSFKEGPDNSTEAAKLRLLTLRARLMNREIPWQEAWSLLSNPNLTRQVIQYKTGLLSRISLFDIMFVTEQLPGTAHIKLSDEVDKWGYRTTDIHWGLQPEEIAHVERMYNIIDQHLVRPFSGRMTFPVEASDWSSRYASAAHHLGACRMSSDASNGVVDADCEVHGHPGLYVCDGSVFSTAGNANPTFTIMALADRLGAHLVEHI